MLDVPLVVALGFSISIAAGLMVQWMPVVHWQLGIVQLVPLWAVVLTLMFLLRFARRPSLLTGLGLGLSTATTYLLCSYYGLMLGVLVIATLPVLLHRRLFQLGHLRWVAVACLAAALAAGPVIWGQWQARGSLPIPPRELVADLSAHPIHFLRTPWPQWIPVPGIDAPDRATPWSFSPGTAKLLLAALGVWEGVRRQRRRRETLFWVALFAFSAALAMGPTLSLLGYGPHDFLAAICPGYAQLRNIYRFATFASWRSWSWRDWASRMFGDSFQWRSAIASGTRRRLASGQRSGRDRGPARIASLCARHVYFAGR